MELWWWVEPLMLTGIVFVLIGAFIVWILSDSKWAGAGIIIFLLCLTPAVISVLSWVVWFFCNIFLAIWQPYFN